MEQIKILTLNDVIQKQRNSVWHKILPILLFVSFMFLNLYNGLIANNTVAIAINNVGLSETIYYCLIYGVIDYLIYRLFMWIYTMILNHSVFAMCIPYIIFKDQFQTCFLIKNVIIGVMGLLLLNAPYALHYIAVATLALNFAIIPIIFSINKVKFIPDLVAHNVFRIYAIPYFIYFFLDIISFVMEVA